VLEADEHVVAASAGNHALGIAYAANQLGREATVVCAETASPAKLAALEAFPVELVRWGRSYDDAERHALGLAAGGRRFVSAYNDPLVVAGGGTLAVELLDELDGPLTIVCPVGGGGLIAGVALWASGRAAVRVVGVESDASPTMRAALDAGAIVEVDERPTIADGLAGNIEEGSITFELVRRHVEDVVLVSEEEIATAMRLLHREHDLVVEGAGAVAAAAVVSGRVLRRGTTVALVTGGNVAPDLFAHVLAGA
jgi:threonine dehydratase